MIWSQELVLWFAAGSFAAISLCILALVVRFRLSRRAGVLSVTHSTPSSRWRPHIGMLAPIVVFVLAIVPLMGLGYFRSARPAADVTILVTGKMWYWTYTYPDQGDFSFRAPMLLDAAADRTSVNARDHIVVPVGKTVRIVAGATNVIYSWAIPAIGAEIEALPGRNNQSWFRAAEEGRYFGTCLELCGLPHAFKPIEVEVVSAESFSAWAAEARRKLNSGFASTPHDRAAR